MEASTQSAHAATICVKESPRKGRVVVARRRFTSGEVILREQPVWLEPTWGDASAEGVLWKWCSVCDCLHPLDPEAAVTFEGLRRPGCEHFYDYCQAMCGVWSAIAAHREEYAMEDMCILSDYCYHTGLNPCSRLHMLEDLKGHSTSHNRSAVAAAAAVVCEAVRERNAQLGVKALRELDHDTAVDLLNAIRCNAYSVPEALNGMALFATTSMAQHACIPNALGRPAVSDGRLVLTLRAVRPVEEGENISICYDAGCSLVPLSRRQAFLGDVYGFQCDCSLCSGPDHTRAFHCSCGGVVSPSADESTFACGQCGVHADREALLAREKALHQELQQQDTCRAWLQRLLAVSGHEDDGDGDDDGEVVHHSHALLLELLCDACGLSLGRAALHGTEHAALDTYNPAHSDGLRRKRDTFVERFGPEGLARAYRAVCRSAESILQRCSTHDTPSAFLKYVYGTRIEAVASGLIPAESPQEVARMKQRLQRLDHLLLGHSAPAEAGAQAMTRVCGWKACGRSGGALLRCSSP